MNVYIFTWIAYVYGYRELRNMFLLNPAIMVLFMLCNVMSMKCLSLYTCCIMNDALNVICDFWKYVFPCVLANAARSDLGCLFF